MSRLEKQMRWYKVRVTFIEKLLATNPASKTLHGDYVASKAPDDDERKLEIESLPKIEEMGTTVFLRDKDTQQIWLGNHMFKGFLKAAGEMFRMTEDPEAKAKAKDDEAEEDGEEKPKAKKTPKTWGNIKSKINTCVQVYPKQLMMFNIAGEKALTPEDVLQRSLRAETMMGPRVALAKSETLGIGSFFEATVVQIGDKPVTKEMLFDCMKYGKVHGLGQWRNAGFGAFIVDLIAEGEGEPEILDERVQHLRKLQAAVKKS